MAKDTFSDRALAWGDARADRFVFTEVSRSPLTNLPQ